MQQLIHQVARENHQQSESEREISDSNSEPRTMIQITIDSQIRHHLNKLPKTKIEKTATRIHLFLPVKS